MQIVDAVDVIELTIDGRAVSAPVGTTILQASRAAGIDIPSLCQDDRLEPFAACRLCLVEVQGARAPLVSCATVVAEGMVVTTETDELTETRKALLELLLSDHHNDCIICERSGQCRLQELAYRYDVGESDFLGERRHYPVRDDNPFVGYDPAKCILCGRCVGICEQVQQCHVLDFAERGFPSLISTSFGRSMLETECELCGNCVSSCPTGALYDIPSRHAGRTWDAAVTDTVCPFCGCGCQIQLHVVGGRVVRVTADVDKAPNHGNLCVKGRYGYAFINHPDRLTRPLVRRDGELVPATWDEALDVVAKGLGAIKAEYGADAVAGFASARCTNEENYLFQKLMRAVVGTNNVDHCARLCHASSVSGLAQSLGSGAMTNGLDDLTTCEAFLVIGSNTTETHPIVGLAVKTALRKGARLIVADPREIDLARRADIHLQLRPGTNVALLNGLAHVIVDEGLADDEFVRERTEGYDEMREALRMYTPEMVEEITGVRADDVRRAARMYATAGRAAILYAMGITQHSHGTEHVLAISNLALLTGNVGRPGTGVNPLRGQNNVQGACDMGALPNVYTGYQQVADAAARAKMSAAWGVELPSTPGLALTEAVNAMLTGDIRGLLVMGENPLLSDPDISHAEEALRDLDFIAVQDIFLSETAAIADVVLPATSFAEKEGTFTNTERKVQRVRKAVDAPGEARTDWEILVELANRLGATPPWSYDGPAAVMDEVASVTPSLGGISFERLEQDGLCWPCPTPDHPGTPILHIGSFTRGKGRLFPVAYQPPAEVADEEYPLTLTTGRMLEHYHTGTMTRRVDGLNELVPTGFVEVNPVDATRLGVDDGARVKLETRRGSIEAPALVTERVDEGTVFVTFHFWESPGNRLTNAALDPVAKIPEYKVCGCRLSAVSAAPV